MTIVDGPAATAAEEQRDRLALLDRLGGWRKMAMFGLALFVLLSIVRVATGADQLTASVTYGAALRSTIPILLAGLAALWADRVGIVNIGIEGMMILGTWFGGWAAWQWGGYVGIVAAIIGGMIGGLIHGVAVIKFDVEHVISGVAINLLAFGAMRYFSELLFVGEQGGGITQSPPQSSGIAKISLPFLSGGADTPDALGNIENREWFLISDAAGIARGLTVNVSLVTIFALLLVPLTGWILWRTVFGLRLRSSGEQPHAAESLGVRIAPIRYYAMAVSGGLAGLAGGYLSIVATSFYRQGQTQSRGFIGLATSIFGNWRPTGVLGGASLFGFGEALQLVGSNAVPKLFLLLAIIALLAVVRELARLWGSQLVTGTIAALVALFGLMGVLAIVSQRLGWQMLTLTIVVAVIAGLQKFTEIVLPKTATFGLMAGLGFHLFRVVDEVPEPLTKAVPFALTLVVLATAAQRLRPPAYNGRPFRSGEEH